QKRDGGAPGRGKTHKDQSPPESKQPATSDAHRCRARQRKSGHDDIYGKGNGQRRRGMSIHGAAQLGFAGCEKLQTELTAKPEYRAADNHKEASQGDSGGYPRPSRRLRGRRNLLGHWTVAAREAKRPLFQAAAASASRSGRLVQIEVD